MWVLNLVLNKVFTLWPYGNAPQPASEERLRRAKWMVGLSYGAWKTPDEKEKPLADSCQSNKDIAGLMGDFKTGHSDAKSAVQFEIANWFAADHVVKEHGVTWKYLDTYEVIRQMVAKWTEEDFRNGDIVLFAEKDHWPRVAKVLRAFGYTPIAPPNLCRIRHDLRSNQKWTRTCEAFREYELKARVFYWLKGYTTSYANRKKLALELGALQAIILLVIFLFIDAGVSLLIRFWH